MVIWYNNTRKRNKKELLKIGKNLTIASNCCILGLLFLGFVSLIHPLISTWLITPTIIVSLYSYYIWINLSFVKSEYYKRFCK